MKIQKKQMIKIIINLEEDTFILLQGFRIIIPKFTTSYTYHNNSAISRLQLEIEKISSRQYFYYFTSITVQWVESNRFLHVVISLEKVQE